MNSLLLDCSKCPTINLTQLCSYPIHQVVFVVGLPMTCPWALLFLIVSVVMYSYASGRQCPHLLVPNELHLLSRGNYLIIII